MAKKRFCKDCAKFYSTGEKSLCEFCLTNDEADKDKFSTPPAGHLVVHCQAKECFTDLEAEKPSFITGYDGLSEPGQVRVKGCAQLNKDFNCPHFSKTILSIVRKNGSKKKVTY